MIMIFFQRMLKPPLADAIEPPLPCQTVMRPVTIMIVLDRRFVDDRRRKYIVQAQLLPCKFRGNSGKSIGQYNISAGWRCILLSVRGSRSRQRKVL
jgi:hypothetical protein